jgi:hypothetical protein
MMTKLIRLLRDYEIPGLAWAIALLILGRGIIWQIYMWLRGLLATPVRPSLQWAVCILYCSFWVWLFLLLLGNGKRYPGMLKDALLSGCLLAVAGVLHDTDVLSVLSSEGFGAAAWITFLGGCGLVIRIFASMSRNAK